jgi:hypothetical protein
MNYFRHAILVFAVIAFLPAYSLAETKVYETLTFNEFHDPGWMKLTRPNGEQVTADFFYSLIEYEDISEWKEGEPIEVTVSDSEGVLIRRQKTDRVYLVVFNDAYPIDNRLGDCHNEDFVGTHHDANCHDEATYYWRAYSEALLHFLSQRNDSKLADVLRKEAEAWNDYVESRNAGIRAYIDQKEFYGTNQVNINASDSRIEAQYRFSTLVRYLE